MHTLTSSDRYQSAVSRIQHNPWHDSEAWQALMNECTSLYRTQVLPLLEDERMSFQSSLHNSLSNTNLDVNTPHRKLLELLTRSKELNHKLDWVESCHGYLLTYFPYCANYLVSVCEMLLARSALPFESWMGGNEREVQCNMGLEGRQINMLTGMIRKEVQCQTQNPLSNLNTMSCGFRLQDCEWSTDIQKECEEKMEWIFRKALGVEMDGTVATCPVQFVKFLTHPNPNQTQTNIDISPVLGGMCTSSIDLWILYIRKRSRDARRAALNHHFHPEFMSTLINAGGDMARYMGMGMPMPTSLITEEGEALIRGWMTQAYETALAHGASFVTNNHLLWRQYITFTQSWLVTTTLTNLFLESMNTTPTTDAKDMESNVQLAASQKQHLRSIYQRIVVLPMTGLDTFWYEYEAFEKSQGEALAAALISEYMPKYQHIRQVYLERVRVYSGQEFQIYRLAVPPVDLEYVTGYKEYQEYESDTSDKGNDIKNTTHKTPMMPHPMIFGSSSEYTLNVNASNQDEYDTKMRDEALLLSKWKRRCGYERTNPERLDARELSLRVRQTYKEYVCAFMRHVEVWHEWATWESYNVMIAGSSWTSTSTGMSGTEVVTMAMTGMNSKQGVITGISTPKHDMVSTTPTLAIWYKKKHIQFALAVLELAQCHIRDSTLLAYASAQLLESQLISDHSLSITSSGPLISTSSWTWPSAQSHGRVSCISLSMSLEDIDLASAAIQVMTDFCHRAGTTLGFVLLQRLVRTYRGVTEARAVFAKARRTLRVRTVDVIMDHLDPQKTYTMEVATGVNETETRRLVTNRFQLQDSATSTNTSGTDNSKSVSWKDQVQGHSLHHNDPRNHTSSSTSPSSVAKPKPKLGRTGFLTWHLYAAHAILEQRRNHSPGVAERVYELGLKRHRTFLTTSSYVIQYANLLLELKNESNVRALLTRAIAACEEQNLTQEEEDKNVLLAKREAQRPLWDTMLKFEGIWSSRCADSRILQNLESRRRFALYSSSSSLSYTEAVAGSMGNSLELNTEDVGVGIHKISVQDLLIRTDGYDVSSRIANGLHRMVDGLETMGILDSGSTSISPASIEGILAGTVSVWKDDGAGGLSDASFRRRSRYLMDSKALAALPYMNRGQAMGVGTVPGMAGAVGTPMAAGKFLSAKERYMAQSAAAASQSSPEWLKTLLALLLAATPNVSGTKASIPMIAMALGKLREFTLPSVRPMEESTNILPIDGAAMTTNPMGTNSQFSSGIKRRFYSDKGGDDSSGDENPTDYGSGYGQQFRARQHSRMVGWTAGSGVNGNVTSSTAMQG